MAFQFRKCSVEDCVPLECSDRRAPGSTSIEACDEGSGTRRLDERFVQDLRDVFEWHERGATRAREGV